MEYGLHLPRTLLLNFSNTEHSSASAARALEHFRDSSAL